MTPSPHVEEQLDQGPQLDITHGAGHLGMEQLRVSLQHAPSGQHTPRGVQRNSRQAGALVAAVGGERDDGARASLQTGISVMDEQQTRRTRAEPHLLAITTRNIAWRPRRPGGDSAVDTVVLGAVDAEVQARLQNLAVRAGADHFVELEAAAGLSVEQLR
jgi:hypothetical protein